MDSGENNLEGGILVLALSFWAVYIEYLCKFLISTLKRGTLIEITDTHTKYIVSCRN